MNAFRAGLVTAACLVGSVYAIACAAPYSPKTLVVECDKESATGDDCEDKGDKSSPRRGSGPSSESNPSQTTEETEPAPTTPAADAGADSGKQAGPMCKALEGCCQQLEKAGFTGSVRQCRSVVADGNEFSCNAAHNDYKQPDESSDFVCN